VTTFIYDESSIAVPTVGEAGRRRAAPAAASALAEAAQPLIGFATGNFGAARSPRRVRGGGRIGDLIRSV